MAKPLLIQALSKLSKKVDALMIAHKKLSLRVRELEEENNRLRWQHRQDTEALQKAYKDIEFLSMSHRLADSPEALVAARNKISKLLRTIDSCIRMIKED